MTDEKVQKLIEWVARNKPLFEVFLDAYCIVDSNNQVLDFNVAFTELCGESYRKILKIKHFCELLRTEHCPFNCLAVKVIQTGEPARLDELRGTSRAFPDLQLIMSGIPIRDDSGELLGALMNIRNVSAETELQKKYGERTKASVTDGLTHLYNKVYTEVALVKFVKAATRDKLPLSVAMVDVDHFKKVNDTYGHQAGDYVLSLTAQLLSGESRETDIVGRFGGEEFTALLPNCNVAGAKIFAERFRTRVEKTKFVFHGVEIPVRVSIGTSTFIDHWKDGMNPEKEASTLVQRADSALYFAKASGRNQTRQYEAMPAAKDKKAA